MHSDGATFTPEAASLLRVEEALQSLGLPSENVTSLLATFMIVWRDAADELGIATLDERQRLCTMAADAIIAFAEAGLQPEQIRRFARSSLRFMGSAREAAAAM